MELFLTVLLKILLGLAVVSILSLVCIGWIYVAMELNDNGIPMAIALAWLPSGIIIIFILYKLGDIVISPLL